MGSRRTSGHLARASSARAILDEGALISPALAAVARELGCDALDLALRGGEDYALVVGLPKGATLDGFRPIGWFEAPSEASAVALRRSDGSLEPLQEERGFDHFGNPSCTNEGSPRTHHATTTRS